MRQILYINLEIALADTEEGQLRRFGMLLLLPQPDVANALRTWKSIRSAASMESMLRFALHSSTKLDKAHGELCQALNDF